VITFTPSLETLLEVARNGDDLRVRAGAIEIELAALNIGKSAAQVDALLGRIAVSDVSYAYRALREITDEALPDNAPLWRHWYAAHGAETTEKFRRFEDGRRPF